MEAFYGCYLLQSLKQERQTYIGFTVDPRRRIRQHNGELKMGARKTRKWRPWKMVMCVWGFPNRVAALQFEFAWQHPAICRHLRGAAELQGFCHKTKRGWQRFIFGVKKNVQVVLEMLSKSPYCGMPLQVHVLDPATYESVFRKLPAVQRLPKHMSVAAGSFDDLEQTCAELMMVAHRPIAASSCSACKEAFREQDRLVACPACQHPFHVSCAAQAFLGTGGTQLLPRAPGACPHCGHITEWPALVRTARRFSQTAACAVPQPQGMPGARVEEEESDSDGSLPSVLGEDQELEASQILTQTSQMPALHVGATAPGLRGPVHPALDCPTFAVDSEDEGEDQPLATLGPGAGCIGIKRAEVTQGTLTAVSPDEADPGEALRSRLFKKRRGDSTVYGI